MPRWTTNLYIFLVTRESLKIYTPPVKPEDLWKQINAVGAGSAIYRTIRARRQHRASLVADA